jgi:hypothetical protein
LKKTTLPGNFTRNKKKTNYKEKKKENSKFCILTLLYLENDKSHKKSVSILYKDQRFPGACNRFLFQNCVWWSHLLTKMAGQLSLV